MINPASLQNLTQLNGNGLDARGLNEAQSKKLDEVTTGFESIFLRMLLEPLEKMGESFFGSGPGSKTFAGLFRQNLADTMARTSPLGIGQMVQDALTGPARSLPSDSARSEAGPVPGPVAAPGEDAAASVREWMAHKTYGKATSMTPAETQQLRVKLAVEDLCDILGRLHAGHGKLLDVIQAKQQALIEVQIDELQQCRDQEEALLREIVDEEKERLLVTEEIGDLLGHDEPGSIRVAEMLPRLSDELAARLSAHREELRENAVEMARQNAVNRALIEHSLGHVQVFMTRLASEMMSTGNYGDSAQGENASFLMDRKG